MSNTTDVTKKDQSRDSDTVIVPVVDVIEDSSGINLFADLPGVTKEKLNMQIQSDSLIIEGELSIDIPKDLKASRTEVNSPRYRRTFTLSKELDTEKVTAELKQGVLKVRIPKAEHALPRKIPIKVQ